MQYGLCARIGTGTGDDPYRPVVADYNCSYVSVNKNDDRFFVKFTGGDEAGAIADVRVIALDRPLTDTLTALQASVVNNRLNVRFGITTNPISAGMTVQQVYDIFLNIVDDSASFSEIKLNGSST